MDVLLAMKAAVRRWYVAGPMLLVTMIAAANSFLHSASAWQASGSLLILPPLAPAIVNADNGGTRLQATLLADNLNSDVVQASLRAKGATGVFQAKASTELPLVSVAVEANSADVATNTLKIVLDNSDAVLADVQQRIGMNKANFYRTARSVADSSPTFAASSRLVGAIGILVGGTALTILLSALIDGLLTRRRSNTRVPDQPTREDHPQPVDTPARGHHQLPASPPTRDDPPHLVDAPAGGRPRHAMNGSAPTTTSQPETTWHPPLAQHPPEAEPLTVEPELDGRDGTPATEQQPP